MSFRENLRRSLLGAPLDPFSKKTRHSIALAAFFAWVGLGADGISSSAYGPEEAFRALGEHTHLGLYLALATMVTVFIIALAYNQVIELFPTGGGGYRVATTLLGPHAGLVSGAALIVDYVLTIAISVASGVDALFSLLPVGWQSHKLSVELALVVLLMVLNLRGAKETIAVLLPIFLGFMISHAVLIVYGVLTHAAGLVSVVPETIAETGALAGQHGWYFVAALFLRAYSLGGGTYTGIEAVSNNVDRLAEPRIHTGKLTMLYMAISLSFTAGGIVLLYLLWNVAPVEGQTLNAVAFSSILADMGLESTTHALWLAIVLGLEACLLFVAANTGFLGGPAVLANMAADSWVPHKFRYLSTRLVTENGIVLLGIAALGITFLTRGQVSLLVVLYSINVFLTFTLSLVGMCVYWVKHRERRDWPQRLALSGIGAGVTGSILVVTVLEKFYEGGWATIAITGVVIATCLWIQAHYRETKIKLHKIDQQYEDLAFGSVATPPAPDPQAPTAVFLVGSSRGGGMHALTWVQRMFAGHFRNFVFINSRTVDARSYGGVEAMRALEVEANVALSYFVNYCHSNGWAAKSYLSFGTDPIEGFVELCEKVRAEFPNAMFFTSKLIFKRENWAIQLLHNQAALVLQERLHTAGMQMVILPMRVEV
jgi:amino acid transporter